MKLENQVVSLDLAKRLKKLGVKQEPLLFEWSNKNHKYNLKRSEWWELCAKCHREYDRKKFGWVAWNKGKHFKSNDALEKYRKTHGSWNKGKKTGLVPRSAFKVGNVPWNSPHSITPFSTSAS